MPATTSSQPHQAIGVCVVVLDDQQRVLLGKRKNSYKAGWFGIPGGRVEPGEALVACAKRELHEETGLKALAVEYVGVIKDFQNDHDFIHFVFTCSAWSGTVVTAEPDKCEGWEWFAVSTLPEPILPAHEQAITLWQGSPWGTYVEM
jgi:8-oxo-dGTP diphosphatase